MSLLLVYFYIPIFMPKLLLYFCLFVDHVSHIVFVAFVYRFKDIISIFVTILSPLSVMSRYSLEQRWYLLKKIMSILPGKKIFSAEACFHLGINNQNWRIWSYRNQRTHYERLFGKACGSEKYFFENEDSAAITDNGSSWYCSVRYGSVKRLILIPIFKKYWNG